MITQGMLISIETITQLAIQKGGHRREHVCSDSMSASSCGSAELDHRVDLILRCHKMQNSHVKDWVVEKFCILGQIGIMGNR